MDAADFTIETWRNLAITYHRLESIIDAFMPHSRRQNSYCKSLLGISEQCILGAQSVEQLRSVFNNDRYRKLNLEAYARHRTVEFRQHSGTINFTKMENWIRFVANMITFAQQGTVDAGCQLSNIPFATAAQKIFFKLRTKKLAR